MKKHLFLLALLGGSATAAHAQSAIAAGTIALGGGIGYNRESGKFEDTSSGGSSTESSTSQFSFTPQFAYFVADNTALGVEIGLVAESYSGSSGGKTVTSDARTSLRVGPFGQYYQMISDQFGLVGKLGLGYQRTFEPDGYSSSSSDETTGSGFYAALTPSVVFFPIPKFSINASIGNLGYDRLSFTSPGQPDDFSITRNNIGANFGLDQLQFGGTFYIGR